MFLSIAFSLSTDHSSNGISKHGHSAEQASHPEDGSPWLQALEIRHSVQNSTESETDGGVGVDFSALAE